MAASLFGIETVATRQDDFGFIFWQWGVGPKTSYGRLLPSRAASGNRIGTAKWTGNAHPVLLKNSTRSRPQGRNADYSPIRQITETLRSGCLFFRAASISDAAIA